MTLLKCLLARLRSRQGRDTLNGRGLRQIPARERARHIAYVAQATQLAFLYSVEEVILMVRAAICTWARPPPAKIAVWPGK